MKIRNEIAPPIIMKYRNEIASGSYHSVSHRLGKCLHRRLFPAQKIYETDAVGK